MPTDDLLEAHDRKVCEERDERKALRAKNNVCPSCGFGIVIPLGGKPTCWWECECGAYSPLKPTWEEALADPNWLEADPEVMACMVPPM